MRTVLIAAALAGLTLPAAALSGRDARDLMADFDLAWTACKARTEMYVDQNPACRRLKVISGKLERSGLHVVPEPDSAVGLRWD